MLNYLMFAVALVLSTAALVFAGLAQIAAIAALLFFGALVGMVDILMTPVTDRPYMKLSTPFCQIVFGLMMLTFLAPGFIAKVAAACALIVLAKFLIVMYLFWVPDSDVEPDSGIGLPDQESQVGKEADRYFAQK